MLLSGANVIIWDKMLSHGMQCYHLGQNVILWDDMLIIWHAMLSCAANVIWDKMLSSGANVLLLLNYLLVLIGGPAFLGFFLRTNYIHTQ